MIDYDTEVYLVNIRLERVTLEEQPILHNIMQFYIYEFSKYLKSIKLDDHGRYEPFQLEAYWSSPTHHPFLLKWMTSWPDSYW